MGSWSETCAISFMPITYGEPCVLLYIADFTSPNKGNEARLCYQAYSILSLPFYGNYNDYGEVKFDKDLDVQNKLLRILMSSCKSDSKPCDSMDIEEFHSRTSRGEVFVRSNRVIGLDKENNYELIYSEDHVVLVPILIKRTVWDYLIARNIPIPKYMGGDINFKMLIDSGNDLISNYGIPSSIDKGILGIYRGGSSGIFGFLEIHMEKQYNLKARFYKAINTLFSYESSFVSFSHSCNSQIIEYIEDKNTEIVKPLSEIYMLTSFLLDNRRSISPTVGLGSQQENYEGSVEFYSKMLEIAKKDLKKRKSRYK